MKEAGGSQNSLGVLPVVLIMALLVMYCSPVGAQEAEADYQAGLKHFHAEEYEEAVPLLEAATKQNPALQKAWHALGFSLYRLDKKRQALLAFEKAMALEPGDQKLRDFVERLRAKIDGDNDSPPSRGLGALREPALALKSQNSVKVNKLLREARRRLDSGDPWGAMDLAEEAIGLEPKNSQVLDVLARAYHESGFEGLSRATLREGGKMPPSVRSHKQKSEIDPKKRSKPQKIIRYQDRNKRLFKRSSGGRLAFAFPSADAISKSGDTYSAFPLASTDIRSLHGDLELMSAIRVGKVELELTIVSLGFRRGFEAIVNDPFGGFVQSANATATSFLGGIRVPRPLGSWDIVFSAALGYVRGTVNYDGLVLVSLGGGLLGAGQIGGRFQTEGLALEARVSLDRYVSPQISLGPFIRYRHSKLTNFRGRTADGINLVLAVADVGIGEEIIAADVTVLNLLGAEKARVDLGGLSAGLELRYHY